MRLKIVQISWKIVFRKKTRAILTILSISLAVLFSMFFSGLQQGYSKSISQDIQNVGAHILAIPKGCPYEATATLLHGGILPKQLPEDTLKRIEGIDNVRSAYSTLIGILPSIQAKEQTDRVAGITRSIKTMKNGWSDISTEKIEEFFKKGKSVVLGSNIAIEYGVKVGDKIKIKSPDSEFIVLHILPETKSKDDQSIFVPLFLAQEWFNQEGYVTSIAVSVKEIGKIKATSKEIETITDVQAVTMNEIVDMLTKYIDMLKWLMTGILLIVVFSSTLQIFNVMMLNTLEQIKKIAVIKIFGATKEQISFVIVFQSLLLAILGFAFGLFLYLFLAQPLTHLIGLLYKTYISSNVVLINLKTVSIPFVITLLSVTLSSIYPIYLSNSKKPIMMLHDNVNL